MLLHGPSGNTLARKALVAPEDVQIFWHHFARCGVYRFPMLRARLR